MKKYSVQWICLAALLAFPLVVTRENLQDILIQILMWVAVGSAWNLLAGYTGQVSFGAAAFYGTGAYASALLYNSGASAWWGMALGGIVAVALAFPFGWICFRLRGAYFALGTLALNEILRNVATVWKDFTEGSEGITLMQITFDSKMPYYYIALAIAVLSIVAVEFVIRSRWGYYFVSIREDQEAAESMGINTRYYKMISLCIHAFIIGTVGALYMNYFGHVAPERVFSLHDVSIMAILVGIVGGVGTVYGPAVGAFVMVGLSEAFRTGGFGLLEMLANFVNSPVLMTFTRDYVKKAHLLAFGLLVIVVILYLPNGLVGDWEKIKRRFSSKKPRTV